MTDWKDIDKLAIDEFVNVEALVRHRRPRTSHALLVSGDVQLLAVPRVTRIVMDRVPRGDVSVGRLDVAVVPHFLKEAPQARLAFRHDILIVGQEQDRVHRREDLDSGERRGRDPGQKGRDHRQSGRQDLRGPKRSRSRPGLPRSNLTPSGATVAAPVIKLNSRGRRPGAGSPDPRRTRLSIVICWRAVALRRCP